MLGSRGITAADRDLLASLEAQGYSLTSRKLKRWRNAGVLTTPIQCSAGRGHGRRSIAYPPEALEQATAIVELLAQRVPLNQVAVAMFIRGVPVNQQAVRHALLELLDLGLAGVSDPDERADQADRLAQHALRRARRHPLGRHWSNQAGRRHRRRQPVLGDMLAGLLGQAITGEPPSRESKAAITEIVGIPSDDATRFHRMASMLTLENLQQVASAATLAELDVANQQVREMFADIPAHESAPNYAAAGLIILGMAFVNRQAIEEGNNLAL
jgi:hypothetical protein